MQKSEAEKNLARCGFDKVAGYASLLILLYQGVEGLAQRLHDHANMDVPTGWMVKGIQQTNDVIVTQMPWSSGMDPL